MQKRSVVSRMVGTPNRLLSGIRGEWTSLAHDSWLTSHLLRKQCASLHEAHKPASRPRLRFVCFSNFVSLYLSTCFAVFRFSIRRSQRSRIKGTNMRTSVQIEAHRCQRRSLQKLFGVTMNLHGICESEIAYAQQKSTRESEIRLNRDVTFNASRRRLIASLYKGAVAPLKGYERISPSTQLSWVP